ncbi:flavin reductase family protein [Sphingorhabdus sp.]|jgi:3-hydroxy-9,10-secoandrosta-1,3,5(10)-triene-9,17-dione monooxygenase reductase component|uniref:flavin reductase family protein n=1 Tax=Sphingorhabdus sp. TaxID=1902408 RepID=UPI0037CC5291
MDIALTAINPRHFRDVMGCHPTGVCVVTAAANDGARFGMVVGSFTSISLDPPLVGFFPDKKSTSWPRIEATGHFCANILAANQVHHSSRFASRIEDKFEGIDHRLSPHGQPLLEDVLAWIDCSIESVTEIGDHLLVVGAVRSLEKRDDGTPLLFFRGGYHGIVDCLDPST